jgi:hypothetical protein
MNADGVPKEGLRTDETLVRIANISLIEAKVHVYNIIHHIVSCAWSQMLLLFLFFFFMKTAIVLSEVIWKSVGWCIIVKDTGNTFK